MPKKSTLKSRRNKRNVSLKKKSRKGGAVWDFLKSKEKPEPKEEPEDDLKKVVEEEIPPVPEPKTFNQLQDLFPEGIPLDIFTIDMEKIQKYKMMEKKFESLLVRILMANPYAQNLKKNLKKKNLKMLYYRKINQKNLLHQMSQHLLMRTNYSFKLYE